MALVFVLGLREPGFVPFGYCKLFKSREKCTYGLLHQGIQSLSIVCE